MHKFNLSIKKGGHTYLIIIYLWLFHIPYFANQWLFFICEGRCAILLARLWLRQHCRRPQKLSGAKRSSSALSFAWHAVGIDLYSSFQEGSLVKQVSCAGQGLCWLWIWYWPLVEEMGYWTLCSVIGHPSRLSYSSGRCLLVLVSIVLILLRHYARMLALILFW